MADLRKLKDKAAELAAKGKLEKAADVLREVLQADPKDVGTRQKLAELLRRAGQVAEAVARYEEVAERFAKDGLLIKSIAICKTILELDPTHATTQAMLADLYGRRAQAEGTRPPARTVVGLRAAAEPSAEPERGVAIRLAPASVVPAAPAADRFQPIELSPELQPPEPAIEVSVDLTPEPSPGPEVGAPGEPDGEQAIELDVEPAPEPPPPAEAAAELPVAVEAPDPFAEIEARYVATPPLAVEAAALQAAGTPFARIMSAAEQAIDAGVAETIDVDVDQLEDAGPVPGDEPAGAEEPIQELAADAFEPIEAAAPPPDAGAGLPRVPLFSDLGREAFLALTEGMVLRRFTDGEAVITEGELGTGFFVVASGGFVVTKRDPTGDPVPLAHLSEGDFFGEMALLSGAPRAASVVAAGAGEVLEIPAAVLQSIAGAHPHVAASLRRFYRQRLLANAMAVSPIFSPFGKAERKAVIERFRTRDVEAREVLIREGEKSDGLYVILDGLMDVTKRKDGAEVLAGQLREGDLFGEVSCLRKTAATATVTARRGGTVLRLPRAAFDELVMSYPQILELVSTLSDERLESLDAIVSGRAEFTEDGLVLI
jgi:CRP-like cAMP-binding protein